MRVDESDLLIALHEGPYDRPLWNGFLERLRLRVGAWHTSLFLRPTDEKPVVQLHCGELASLPEYLGAKFGGDGKPYRTMREGRIYALEELADPGLPAAHGEGIPPWSGDTRLVRVSEQGGLDAWLICAGVRAGGSATSALLTVLVPHMRVALRTFATLERERFRSAATSEAFRRLDFGWLTLDARCRIIDANPHMEQLFQRSSVLRRDRYDRLTPASPAIDRALTALVKRFASEPDARPQAINLSRDPRIDMLARPLKHRSRSTPTTAVAVVHVSGDRWSQADRCDQLVDLFGLLPSEARLAWAIAQGLSIAEAAEDLGLTLETARNYSKKVYAKAGARGQVELMRNILTGILASP